MRSFNQQCCRALSDHFELATAILDSVHAPAMVVTSDGHIRYFNRACEQLSGYSKEEIIGRSVWEAPLLKSQADTVKAALATIEQEPEYSATWVTRSGILKPLHWTYTLCSSSGEYWISTGCDRQESQGTASVNENGNDNVLGNSQPVQTLKEKVEAQAEQLRQANQELQYIVENTPLAVIEWDRDMRVKRWSTKAEAIFGWRATEVLGKHPYEWQFVHQEDLEVTKRVIAEFSHPEKTCYIQTNRNYTKSGSVIYCEWYNSVSLDESGQLVSVLSLAQDITARYQAEAALQESEKRYRSIYENTPVMLHSIDSNGNIMSVSHYWLEKLGYEKSEVIGKKSSDFLTEDSRRYAVEVVLPTFFRDGECQDVPYRFVKKNGDALDVLLSAIAERDSQGNIVRSLAVLTDVTERQRAEQELLRLNQKLLWSNQELEQYAYMASHDLREPLRKIKSYTELLFERYADRLDAKANKYQRAITGGVARMENLISDLLACSRVSRAELLLEPVELNGVLEQVKDNLKVAIEENQAEIIVQSLPTVAAHRSQMIQLFQNLLSNSIKFRTEATPVVEVKAEQRGKEWLISVADNGIGINPQYAERVFVIFQRLHSRSQYEGTGIGLTICKKIVERHGGRIWLEAAETGTVFCFTFPAVLENASPPLNKPRT